MILIRIFPNITYSFEEKYQDSVSGGIHPKELRDEEGNV